MTTPTPQPGSSHLTAGDPARYTLDEKKMYLDSGALGRFFGSGSNAATDVSGLAVLILLGTGVVLIFHPGGISTEEYFKVATPIITLALGYMFGKMPSAGRGGG